jgi:sigma-B regulation protein RsbU (phosphoserine phosphatase)
VDHGYEALTTAVIVSYYLKNNHLYYSYAGHPPMLAQSGSSSWHDVKLPDTPEARNLPLGAKRNARYDMGEVPYQKGDRLFLYSDGVIEAPGRDRDLFGVDRLRSTLESAGDAAPMQIKSHILAALREWTGGSLDHDDVTLVAIQLA